MGGGRGQSGGSCEYGNGPLGSVKGSEYFDHLRGCELLKAIPVPWSQLTSAGRVVSQADSQAIVTSRRQKCHLVRGIS